MAQSNVTVTINGKDYPMACAAGEEGRVRALGGRIDEVVQEIVAASGAISESRLLVMAALILTDRLDDLEAQVNKDAGQSHGGGDTAPHDNSEHDDKLAEVLEVLAGRLERLAGD